MQPLPTRPCAWDCASAVDHEVADGFQQLCRVVCTKFSRITVDLVLLRGQASSPTALDAFNRLCESIDPAASVLFERAIVYKSVAGLVSADQLSTRVCMRLPSACSHSLARYTTPGWITCEQHCAIQTLVSMRRRIAATRALPSCATVFFEYRSLSPAQAQLKLSYSMLR